MQFSVFDVIFELFFKLSDRKQETTALASQKGNILLMTLQAHLRSLIGVQFAQRLRDIKLSKAVPVKVPLIILTIN